MSRSTACRWHAIACSDGAFDVYANKFGPGFLLDCHSNIVSATLATRLVVPLLPPGTAPRPARRLNPIFAIEGHPYVMITQFAAAVAVHDLGEQVTSLIAHDTAIIAAIDMLLSGY